MDLTATDIESLKNSLQSAIKKGIILDVFKHWILLPPVLVNALFFKMKN